MTSNFAIPAFPPFECDLDSLDLKQKWKRYITKFENLTIAMNITNTKRKRAMLLHYIGEPINDILETLTVGDDSYEETKKALDDHFAPSQNKEYQTYLFRKCKQRSSESLEQFNVRLRRAATLCEFESIEREIKSQLIMGCESTKLRRHALQSPNSTLQELLTYGIAAETVNRHVELIETDNRSEVNYTRQSYKNRSSNNPKHLTEKTTRKDTSKQTSDNQNCKNCGNQWHQGGLKQCPARGKTCLKCGKENHFARVCITSRTSRGIPQNKQTGNIYKKNQHEASISHLEENKTEDEDYFVFSNQMEYGNNTPGRIILNTNNKLINFMIDSGANVNIINNNDYEQLQPKPQIYQTNNLVYPYGQKSPIKMLGKCKLDIQHQQQSHQITCFISQDKGPSILSRDTSLKLNLIKFINNLATPEHYQGNKYLEYINNKYPQLFDGIGKHKTTTVKLHIDPDIMPVSEKFRRIPFHMRRPVEQEIERLLKDDIIEEIPENTPTTWISPIVVRPKKGQNKEIRICVDMRSANKAIKRERYITPTIDDLIILLNKACHFTKLDLKKGYHQFELNPDSRHISTFATHKGLYRYKRLSFGINTAAEIFQKEINKLINNISNTINMSDDILVYGTSQSQHDEALQKVLAKLTEAGLTLNKDKCIFNKGNLNFYGHIFSKEGMRADPEKITALENAKTPQTVGELRSWLGMVNFSNRYIPNLASITQPLRELIKQNTKWSWEIKHQNACDTIKNLLTRYTQLSYFSKSRPTEIWTDAGPEGLGALLIQKQGNQNLVISFASKSLTETESRYSQLEREALAIIWAVEHFHIYIYGGQVTIITDHKPLVPLLNKPRSKLSARLERWVLKLQGYTYEVKYSRGKDNPADYLSRHPTVKTNTCKTTTSAEQYTNFLSNHLIPKDITLEEMKEQTKKDPLIQQVIQRIADNRWHEKTRDGISMEDMRKYHKIRNELTTTHDQSLLLRGHRIIMPLSLQERAIEIAHTGHQGITNTKKLMREKTWFTGINKKIEDKIKHCLECNAATKQTDKLPLNTSKLPDRAWDYLHVDHKGPLPNGKYLLVMIDLYTRFPIVEIVNSTTAMTNINKMEEVFALLGTPAIVCTDNGPPFNSHEFEEFTRNRNIKHRKITPLWPQANGEVERFNRTMSKILKIAFTYKLNYEVELIKFLRNYRVTPHTSTKLPPAELLFNRTIDSGIPTIHRLPKSETINREKIQINDTKAKEKMKQNYDSKHNVKEKKLEVGDKILIKRPKPNKMDTPYNPNPFVVTKIQGPQVTAKGPGQTLTRHITHTKIIQENRDQPIIKQIKDEELDDEQIEPVKINENKEDETPGETGRYNLRKDVKKPQRLLEEM